MRLLEDHAVYDRNFPNEVLTAAGMNRDVSSSERQTRFMIGETGKHIRINIQRSYLLDVLLLFLF